jgi:hypothetical protein
MQINSFRSGLMVLSLVFTAGVERAYAGVYDDCAAWWHFDYDANTNGIAEASEIRDQCDWGTASTPGSSGKHAAAVYGHLGAPAWTNLVVSPAGGDTYGGMSLWFNPVTNATQTFPDTIKVGGGLLLTNGNATIVTRFRWDGFAFNSANPGWLYNNGLDWTPKTGWMFGVRDDNRLGMYVGQENVKLTSATVTTGVWYDAAAVLTDNGTNDTVEFYLWSTNSGLVYQKVASVSVTNAASAAVGTIIGAEATSSAYATGNALKAFKGLANHIAVWNRALSYAEVMQAFGYPQPRFQIGLKNNSLTDLGPESQTGSDYAPGAPWYTLRRAVTAAYSDASLKIPLAAYQKLNYVLHVRTLTDSGTSAGLSLIVNGTTNQTQTAELGKDLYWYIASSALVTGVNTFTLHYVSGSCAFAGFDWLELGGAWQIGTDNNSASEFIVENNAGDDFYVTDPNWQHLERAITYGDTNTVLHFFLSPELAKKYYYTYTTRIIGQGPSTLTNYAFNVTINGEYTQSFPAQANGTYISVPFDRSHNKTGENTINVIYNGPGAAAGGGWLQFDFHRLTVAEAPKGTLIRMR